MEPVVVDKAYFKDVLRRCMGLCSKAVNYDRPYDIDCRLSTLFMYCEELSLRLDEVPVESFAEESVDRGPWFD